MSAVNLTELTGTQKLGKDFVCGSGRVFTEKEPVSQSELGGPASSNRPIVQRGK